MGAGPLPFRGYFPLSVEAGYTPSMATRSNRVGEILLKAKLIDPLQLRSALARHDQWGGRLAKMVVDLGFAPEDAVVDAIAKELFLKRVQLGHLVKDAQALRKLDASYCADRAVFPVSLQDNGKTLVLAMADPTDLQLVDEVAMKARVRVVVMCAGEGEIQAAVARYYHDREPDRFGQRPRGFSLERGEMDEAPVALEADARGEATGHPRERVLDPEHLDGVEVTEGVSAGELLDEILSPGKTADAALGAEDWARLEAVRDNQEKSTRVLRALTELLEEKGALRTAELEVRRRN